jgi:hypothetical protein
MAGGITIKVEGLDELKRKFNSIPSDIEDGLDAELHAIANEYQNKAAEAAPVDLGFLKNNITSFRLAPLSYEVVSGAPYSAYVEFGTITHVSVPSDLVEYAAKFKGKGLIKTGGIHAQPFFFPHLPWAQSEVVKKADSVVKKALNK